MGYTAYSCLWELTLRCNLNCSHCGSSAGKKRPNELNIDECMTLASQIVELGCRELTFIGGEVQLYPDWKKIGRYFTENGLNVNIMSNGYNYNEKVIDDIEYAGLTNVGISIDGLRERHERIRDMPGSFDRALAALDAMRKRGIHTAVVTCIFNDSMEDLEGLYGVLLDKGVEAWQLQLANSMGRRANVGLNMDPNTLFELTSFIQRKADTREMLVYAADSIGYFCGNEQRIRGGRTPLRVWEGCQAGLTAFFIDSIGNVKGCGSLYSDRFIEGNVRSEPLAHIWRDEDRFSYNRKYDHSMLGGECRSCEARLLCRGGCRSSNYFNNGGRFYQSATCARLKHDPMPSA